MYQEECVQMKDSPSTYFVQDKRNKTELTRLAIQDQMLTTAMGGVLPEQPDPTVFRRVLDVACGTGGWLIEAAKAYPTMSLVGIDISQRMIRYAVTVHMLVKVG
jgi:ubiquinone/menaquinone biosynthesis C-methylase UbiE